MNLKNTQIYWLSTLNARYLILELVLKNYQLIVGQICQYQCKSASALSAEREY